MHIVMPRIEFRDSYLILGVKSGDSIRGWGVIEGGLIICFIFIQKYTFLYYLMMNYYMYCLLNMLIFTIFELQLSQFKITQLPWSITAGASSTLNRPLASLRNEWRNGCLLPFRTFFTPAPCRLPHPVHRSVDGGFYAAWSLCCAAETSMRLGLSTRRRM